MARPLYTGIDVSHPLLSPKVLALANVPNAAPNDKFTAQQVIAEVLLGATAPALTDADKVQVAELAIVRQMNFQVEQGLDPFTQESAASSHSKQSVVWRDRFLDPVAAAIWASIGTETTLDQLLSKYSGTLRSVRTDDDDGRTRPRDPNCTDRMLESRFWRHVF